VYEQLWPEILTGPCYVITVMDAFSRAILSSGIFQGQDLACVLIVLYAAVERFGAPRCLITDNGGVFRAKQLLTICEALDIEKEYIHPRQSWENLVETHESGAFRTGDQLGRGKGSP
jgi:transposase InsO family protein